ncbi:cytochrome P450, partial [Lophiostoma macrostomum CBS 122681]
VLAALYALYQRTWHPLAGYPGPLWASITDFWGAKAFWSGQHPYILTELHERYGPVVRFGPNRLSFTSQDAVNTIFVKGFKTLPKPEFYDTFGSKQFPNLFNERNIHEHFHRRKYLLKTFSPQAVAKWELILDAQIHVFRKKVRQFSASKQPFDLKSATYQMICDIVARLMYGEDFGIQESGLVNRLPDDHRWASWGLTLGSTPAPWRWLLPIAFFVPHPQTGYRRNTLSYALEAQRIMQKRRKDIEAGQDVDRQDTITRAFLANMNEKTENGEHPLTEFYVAHELFGFVFAGVHPPSASLNFLLWNLLHNPKSMDRAASEVEQALPAMTPDRTAYTLAEVEQNLPWLKACIKESFRFTPAFTMPLTRRIVSDTIILNGKEIPKGTDVALCNHAFHHNPEVFGNDHGMYDPTRWERESGESLSKLLMHFGAGGRQCIGKTLALSIINKVTATLLAEFSLELADAMDQQRAVAGEFRGELPPMKSVGISDVKGPIMVMATRRH